MDELPEAPGPQSALPCADFSTYSILRWHNEIETNSEISFSAPEWLFQHLGGSPVCWGLRDSFVRGTCEHRKERSENSLTSTCSIPGNTSHCLHGGALLPPGPSSLVCCANISLPSAPQLAKASESSDPGAPVSTVLLNLATTPSDLSCQHSVCVYFLLGYARRQAEPSLTSLPQESSTVPAKCEL